MSNGKSHHTARGGMMPKSRGFERNDDKRIAYIKFLFYSLNQELLAQLNVKGN